MDKKDLNLLLAAMSTSAVSGFRNDKKLYDRARIAPHTNLEGNVNNRKDIQLTFILFYSSVHDSYFHSKKLNKHIVCIV